MQKNRCSETEIITQIYNLQNKLNQLEKNVEFATVIKKPLRGKLILIINDLYNEINQLEKFITDEIKKKDYVTFKKKKTNLDIKQLCTGQK